MSLIASRECLRDSRRCGSAMVRCECCAGLAPSFRERMRRAGLATPDGIVGVIETGSFDRSRLRQALTELGDGTWELVCHPGY